ncbi:hypothetical protein AVEN_21920-1 [Araneus ventricosus]|uniref:Uncharacterized protein n=1 Tax=Araneus ventricosus TaxID=182803 RepID=A0A4Y2D385_ARAVE|nr:hypothetical protein AVEN_21920-1 [Araneus ventricosus]
MKVIMTATDTEGGVLIAITGHGLTSPAGGTSHHWSGGYSTQTITIHSKEARFRLLTLSLFIHLHLVSLGGSMYCDDQIRKPRLA